MSWQTDAIFPDIKSADNFAKSQGWEVYWIQRTFSGYKVRPVDGAPKWSDEDDDRK